MTVSQQSIQRVVANVVDFDMHNLFEPYTWTEGLQEAAKGTFEAVPPTTVQHEQHAGRPLMLQPKYGPDFLERLIERDWGQPQTVLQKLVTEFQKKAADPNNLLDFSMPSEMHKQQEQPIPNEMLDTFIEFNRPGEGAGSDILKEYHDRGWDPSEAPEMSEDLLMRFRLPPKAPYTTLKVHPVKVVRAYLDRFKGPDAGTVVSSFLMRVMPMQISLDTCMHREAAKLGDLTHPMVYNKKHGYHPLEPGSVTVRLARAEPAQARWTFKATSGGDSYSVVFQFRPDGTQRDVKKLDVFTSCNCPSWVFYGAQYNAHMKDYLFGPIQLKRGPFGAPRVRDSKGLFSVCKHVLRCIPIVSQYKLPMVAKEVRERLKKERKTRVVKIEPADYKVTIPKDLQHLEQEPDIQKAVHGWPAWSPMRRKKFINELEDPDSVAYFAYKFPESATVFVADRLKSMILKGPSEKKAEARDQLEEIIA